MQTEVDEITPVLKWAGGKRALLPSLLPRVPRTLRTYCEPFAGGAALFFALASEVFAGERTVKSFVLCDANPELANLYRVLRSDVDALIDALGDGRAYANTPERFAAVRAARPTDPVERAARFKYLNATCFNGLHRVNRKGEFNVPFGKLANPTICDPERLRAGSRALQLATIYEGDFTEVTSLLGKGDFCYIDSPYYPISATASFTAYAGEFGPREHVRLVQTMRELDGRGCKLLASNSDTRTTRGLYVGFKVDRVDARRSIAANGDRQTAS